MRLIPYSRFVKLRSPNTRQGDTGCRLAVGLLIRVLPRWFSTNTYLLCREAFRGSLILFEQGAIDKGGFNGPYMDSTRQKGFVSYGASHVMRILGSAEVAQRSSWYHKWNVHMYARPEVRFHDVTNHYAHRRASGLIRSQPILLLFLGQPIRSP